MARPIAITPKLNKKATERFLRKVKRDLSKQVGPIPTPKLAEAIKMIKADACKPEK